MLVNFFRHAARSLAAGASVAVIGAILGLTPAVAHDEERRRKTQDHDTALSALSRGEIVRLEVVLAAVNTAVPGEVVGVELKLRQSDWLYEVKVLSPDGIALRVLVDGRTGRVLDTKQKGLDIKRKRE